MPAKDAGPGLERNGIGTQAATAAAAPPTRFPERPISLQASRLPSPGTACKRRERFSFFMKNAMEPRAAGSLRLMLQEPAFALKPAGIAGEFAAGSHHAVARHHDGHRI